MLENMFNLVWFVFSQFNLVWIVCLTSGRGKQKLLAWAYGRTLTLSRPGITGERIGDLTTRSGVPSGREVLRVCRHIRSKLFLHVEIYTILYIDQTSQ